RPLQRGADPGATGRKGTATRLGLTWSIDLLDADATELEPAGLGLQSDATFAWNVGHDLQRFAVTQTLGDGALANLHGFGVDRLTVELSDRLAVPEAECETVRGGQRLAVDGSGQHVVLDEDVERVPVVVLELLQVLLLISANEVPDLQLRPSDVDA